MATALGMAPDEFGGKAWRIGGATDLRDVLGEGGISQINQRGRWATDIAQVYQRAIVDQQLRASADVGSARGEDLESLCAGWSQPASFRG
eukprot:6185330-Pleurochrysis_carterae.AAC.1